MSTVHVRIETVEVPVTGSSPTTGYRAYAADIGLSAEGTTFETCIANIKSAIDTYLGDTTGLIWLKGEMRFSTE